MNRRATIAVLGYGGVGRAFVEVLAESAPLVRARYGIELEIGAVRRSNTQAKPEPAATPADWNWAPAGDLAAFLREIMPDVVVQAVPSDDADRALADSLAALEGGAHLVTATKSHLVRHWGALAAAGRVTGRGIRVSAAAGAALPAADLARRGVRSFGCERIRASLNGTANYVLNEMAAGASLQAAIARARDAGIAEPDPSRDLDGTDAASKLVILANLLWGREASFDDVSREGIDDRAADLARDAAARGGALRSLATATSATDRMQVRLEAVGAGDPFARLPGAEKAVEFDGPAGPIVVSGGRSSPRGAALAMLKDVTNLLTGDDAPGFG